MVSKLSRDKDAGVFIPADNLAANVRGKFFVDKENTDKYFNDIAIETKNSSTLRLLCELGRWDEKYHDKELNLITQELKRRLNPTALVFRLFIICLVEANIAAAYSEHFYPFDNDEKEVRRHIRTYVITHLVTLFIICIIPTTNVFGFNIYLTFILLLFYIPLTIKITIDSFIPVYRWVKKTSP